MTRAKWRRWNGGAGHANRSWPVLLLLLLLILVPTICVLWFMNEAVQNEHLAVREKLRDAYRGHLSLVRERLEDSWRRTLQESDRLAQDTPSAIAFDSCVRAGLADSVLCYDGDGQLAYPAKAVASAGLDGVDAEWQEASRLEYLENDFVAASQAYQVIANCCLDNQQADVGKAARAWQAVARCHARAGRNEDAVEVLTNVLGQQQFATATDLQGRLIVADAELRALGDEKHIWLRAHRAGAKLCFEVEDNGIGMSPRDEKRIFRRFYQVNQHLSRTGGGCELGLSIVQYIVGAHGGTIQVTSRLGKGSKFTVTLSPAPSDALDTTEAPV